MEEPSSRAALRRSHRVCIKAGTSVVTTEDGRPSLTRVGAITEQISELRRSAVEVILVSSGAVGMGKRLLGKHTRMGMSFAELHKEENSKDDCAMQDSYHDAYGIGRSMSTGSFRSLLLSQEPTHTEKKKHYDSACAAAGQFEMMNLYNSLFNQVDVTASQILVTQADFSDEKRLENLSYAVERLLSLGIVPIINENDAVSANLGYTADDVFSDNDSLAALCARSFGAEVLLLLTDVEGVFDSSPKENKNAKLLPVYQQGKDSVLIGAKSKGGRGGMSSKIDAATAAVAPGTNCSACVVASGSDLNSIRGVLGRDSKFKSPGTLFATPGSDLEKQAIADLASGCLSVESVSEEARNKAVAARAEARKLCAMPFEVRKNILNTIADALLDRKEELMAENAIDVEAAEKNGVANVLRTRLKLTEAKLATLAAGLRHIASKPDPLGVVKSRRELSDGLELSQVTVSIGVLMIIFESRPDSMPQISALALASGNGLLLKGGKEASHSNAAIHGVIGDAIEKGSEGQIKRDIVALITSRAEVCLQYHLFLSFLIKPRFWYCAIGCRHAEPGRCY